jgi:hypothetical protein
MSSHIQSRGLTCWYSLLSRLVNLGISHSLSRSRCVRFSWLEGSSDIHYWYKWHNVNYRYKLVYYWREVCSNHYNYSAKLQSFCTRYFYRRISEYSSWCFSVLFICFSFGCLSNHVQSLRFTCWDSVFSRLAYIHITKHLSWLVCLGNCRLEGEFRFRFERIIDHSRLQLIHDWC